MSKHATDNVSYFWEAPDEALFTRYEIAKVRRCSPAKLEREAWQGTGISHIKDGNRALYRKRDVIAYLDAAKRSLAGAAA